MFEDFIVVAVKTAKLASAVMCYTRNQARAPLPSPVLNPQDVKARPLHRAAQRGLATFVSSLLVTGNADPNATDSRGCTPLHWAAQAGQAACITQLVAARADPNAANAQLATPLHTAAEHGHAAAIDALVAAGAAVEARDCTGRTPLWAAAHSGHLPAVCALLSAGAAVQARDSEHHWSVLHAAVSQGHAEVAEQLLAAGADPEALSCCCLYQPSSPCLATSSMEGSERSVVHLPAAEGSSPKAGQTSCVRRLVAARADPSAANAQLATPLHFAAEFGHAAAIDALVAAGAEVEATDCTGRTPLWAAANAGNLAAVRALLAVGADSTARDSEHESSVVQAATSAGHVAVLRHTMTAQGQARSYIRKTWHLLDLGAIYAMMS
ncbi:hypothetical protein N2152v2_003269 [Parachlorella kessleri]